MAEIKNIKSKLICKKIMELLEKNKLLVIICYNKQFQKLLNRGLNDYKEEYFKIEIEIQIANDKHGNFIDIKDEYKPYFHIYLNDNKNEPLLNYITQYEKIKKIKVYTDYEIKSLKMLFNNCECIKEINFIKFHRIDINDMSLLFQGCTSLEVLKIKITK